MIEWLTAGTALLLGASGAASYGAAHPRAQLFGSTITQTHSPKLLALTFDDGPNPAITPKLLDLLDRHRARATFFLVGKYVRESPALVREIADRGHLIANHTFTHPNLFFCGREETHEELLRCSDAIVTSTGVVPRWFRPPFGFRSPWSVETALRLGMRTVMWTLLPGDWQPKPLDSLLARLRPIEERARAANSVHGDILCLHDGDYARPSADRTLTLAALERCLPLWSGLGLKFVTMEAALEKVTGA